MGVPILDEFLQALRECSGCDLAVYLDTTILRERFS